MMSYESFTGRHFQEFAKYADAPKEQQNVIDYTRRTIASVVHLGTSLIEAPLQDIARKIEGGKQQPIPEFRGNLPRTRESVTGAFRNLLRGRVLSAGVQVVQTFGNVAADFTDTAAGVHRPLVH